RATLDSFPTRRSSDLGAAALWRVESLRRAPAMREFATARGRRAAIELADGTRIVLSVDSKLRVPVDYGRTTRAVYLEGEAYFARSEEHTSELQSLAYL